MLYLEMLPYFGCTVHAPQDHPIYYIIICVQVALTTLALSAIGYLTYVVGWGVCFRYIYCYFIYFTDQKTLSLCMHGIHIDISEQSARVRTTIAALDQTFSFLLTGTALRPVLWC